MINAYLNPVLHIMFDAKHIVDDLNIVYVVSYPY